MDNFNFLFTGQGANVILNNVTIPDFEHCFYNDGFLRCYESSFIDYSIFKYDIGVEESGAVIHNNNIAEFVSCYFSGNKMSIGILHTKNFVCWTIFQYLF